MANEPSSNPVLIHQEEVIPTGQHDSHFYDPSAANDHQLMAVYETAAAAEAARQRLVESGVQPAALNIVDRTNEPVEQGGGLWGAIKRFMVADEDAHGYAESVQRGHAVLVVRPEESQQVEVIRALEETGPIDFDARLEEWRAAGWNGVAARQAAGGTGEVTAAPGQAPANQAASSATTTAVGQAATVVQTRDTPGTSGSAAERVTTPARPLQPGAAASGQVYDSSAPSGPTPTPPAAPESTPESDYAGASGLSGGTFTGTDTAGPLGTQGERTAQDGLRERSVGAGSTRVRVYAPSRPTDPTAGR